VRGALEDDPSLFALVPTKPVSYGPGLAYAWLLCDRRDLSFVAVSRDGLYGAAGDLWRWMDKTTTRKLARHYSGIVPGGKTAQGGAIYRGG